MDIICFGDIISYGGMVIEVFGQIDFNGKLMVGVGY